MKYLVLGVLAAGCTSEPELGSAHLMTSSGIAAVSAFSYRGSDTVSFAGYSPGTPCSTLERAGAVDAYHDQLQVQVGSASGSYPVTSMRSPDGAFLSVFDDCSNGSLTCYDATAVFDSGTVTVHYGDDSVTGTIDAHGSSARTADLFVSGTFEATYCR